MSNQQTITRAFKDHFSKTPHFVIRAPGRVNLIGEHTDYNDGFVLPMAIDRAIWIALGARNDRQVRLRSLHFDALTEFSLDEITHKPGWGEYIRGVAWALQEAGYRLAGWEGVMTSDIPIGAGLSSSAAVEMAAAKAFSLVGGWGFDPPAMAQIGQRAENQWVGANTGIMDQMISAAGRAGHALLIDCRDLSTQQIPLPTENVFVVMDTATRHAHTDSGYNERREECEAAARFLGVSHLRDVDLPTFRDRAGGMGEGIRRRARHVITENARVLEAVEALRQGDSPKMGRLMDASHASLRDDFEVTNRELNVMVELSQNQPGCFGARMTGGGFGGSAVALVEEARAKEFTQAVDEAYQAATGLDPHLYVCRASNGVETMARSTTTS
ncbi:MAG: Galactokinase [Chloroflexi bacterium]|nr:Galactokinase [Chloroflexota bacterium]